MKAMKEAGINGIDAVSPFEVEMALMAGFQNEDITYTENFISLEDLEYALNKNV